MPLWTWEELTTCRELIYPTVSLELAWLLFSMFYGRSPCGGLSVTGRPAGRRMTSVDSHVLLPITV
jgi:hypothetical protein